MSYPQYGHRNDHHPIIPISKVLHIRALSSEEKEVDLPLVIAYLGNFGNVEYVVTIPRIRQALIEMENIEQSERAYKYTNGHELILEGKKFCIEYSKSQVLNKEIPYRRSL